MSWDDQLKAVSDAWRDFCRTLEKTGTEALAKTLTHDEVDLAEGLRHLTRMATLVSLSSLENKDSAHPYLWPALDPHRKMGATTRRVSTCQARSIAPTPPGFAERAVRRGGCRSSCRKLGRRRSATRCSCLTWK